MAGENWKNDGNWSWKYLTAWAVLIVGFIVLEGFALFDGNDATPSLTEAITRFTPGFVVFGGIGWLIWHFIASYNEHKILGDDKPDDNENEENNG